MLRQWLPHAACPAECGSRKWLIHPHQGAWMSKPTTLHLAVNTQFINAFGEPHRIVGNDSHWSLRPYPYVAAINILINANLDVPLVWVFDPHDSGNGVFSERIYDEAAIPRLIASIEDRIKHAGRTRPPA
jgi:hypothetical protein